MSQKIYILHQYGAPRHFESLFLMNKKYNDEQIVSIEFSFLRQLVKGVIKANPQLIKKSMFNFLYLINFLFSSNKRIIVGAAPFDIFIVYLLFLKNKHQVIYYSSWPHWDMKNYPKPIYFKWQVKAWEKFLTNIKAVGVTSKVKEGLSQYTKDVTVIPHCINFKIFNNLERSNENKIRILYVGRIVEEKGIKQIIDVINSDYFVDQEIEWWFVGEGNLSDEIKQLEKNQSNIKYFGKISSQSELAAIYKQSNILLLPSIPSKKWEELFGIVLIEAMACGVVPISTSNVGPQTIISHLHDGFLYDYTDTEMLKKYIESLLYDNKKLELLSSNAVKTVLERYTDEINAETWNRVLKF